MTFTQIQARIKAYAGLSSTEADTRIGISINAHYRRITSALGLNAARHVTRSVTTTQGQQYVVFTEIEKIDRILDTTDSTAIRLLQEVSLHTQRSTQPTASDPTTWALRNTDADSVTVLLDTVPQADYDLQADGWATMADLSGSDEPVFPESFHDILTWSVLAEELLKKEKLNIAAAYELKAKGLLEELQFHLADSPTYATRQGESGSTVTGSVSGVGGGNLGATAYTQSALLTFDRGAGLAPFVVAQATAAVVTNLDADKLDGQHGAYYLSRANHTSTELATAGLTVAATDRLLGRDTAGAGAVEEISLNATLSFTGSGAIQRAALTGDVTATAGSNATTIATDVVSYAKMQNISAASKLLGRGAAGGAGDPEEITLGNGISMSATTLNTAGGYPADGRLTLTSGTPVTTADVTAAGTLYYTPYVGNNIATYNGASWTFTTFSERSLTLTLTSGSVYDIFIVDGTLALEALVWTDPTTRATALTYQNGVLVKSGDTTRRYLGTICASGTNTTEDSYAKRFVWNCYHRVTRPMRVLEGTNTWTYNTSAWHQANASAANQLAVVVGLAEDAISAAVTGIAQVDPGVESVYVGIGLDATNALATGATTGVIFNNTADAGSGTGLFVGYLAVGYHYLAWIEYGAPTTTTWIGDNGGALFQSGITGIWRA